MAYNRIFRNPKRLFFKSRCKSYVSKFFTAIRNHFVIACLLILFVVICSPLESSAQEKQVCIDESGKIYSIDSKLEQKLQMFSEYENFQEAIVFQSNDSTFVLEIIYLEQGQVLRKRLPLAFEELSNLRKKVTQKLTISLPQYRYDQSGRARLLRHTLLMSLGFYGWALPSVLEVHDGRTAAAVYLLTSGSSFFFPYTFTFDQSVPQGATELAIFGSKYGIAHGMATGFMLFGDNATYSQIMSPAIIVSVTEGIWGYNFAKETNMSEGSAAIKASMSNVGFLWGLAFAHMADELENLRINGSFSLLGAAGGWYVGSKFDQKDNYTRGDVKILESSNSIGALFVASLISHFKPDREQFYSAAAIIGSAGGVIAGKRLIKNRDFSLGQGLLVNLGEVAGGATGLGLYYIVTTDESSSLQGWLTSGTIGAALGSWLVYRNLEGKSSFLDTSLENKSSDFSCRIRLTPELLLLQTNNNDLPPEIRNQAHLVHLQISF